jgi:hypothetical protein
MRGNGGRPKITLIRLYPAVDSEHEGKNIQFLVITSDAPGANWEGKDEILRNEARHVWRLQQRGIVRNIWFTDPGRDAVLLLECDGAETARTALKDLPLVRSGLLAYTILALTAYDGYERLFERQAP